MRYLLLVLAVIAVLLAVGTFSMAESAIHEIEGLILFLMAAVFISGAGIVEAIHYAKRILDARVESLGLEVKMGAHHNKKLLESIATTLENADIEG